MLFYFDPSAIYSPYNSSPPSQLSTVEYTYIHVIPLNWVVLLLKFHMLL